ncbi:ABC transporter ATP-binding protein [Seleniivibrio sp.]|uniref:ABC transporter ATP-binding protein n=1 Tax=Seleniivibrio sp. TaxID=2898801 RepID=UPI0025F5C27A|nr:ABC transporter ATP-binding protein [Seleniivibrio sp.]MCD8553094.1 ABC transporter ATP-binding protein [Seleniivibrio sp.]
MYEVICSDLSYSYGESKVLEGVSLKAESGDFVCLLGPSGCGKSTLLRLLAGLSMPDSGNITINGEQVIGTDLERGVVFQDYSLFPWMTVGENIVLALRQAFPKKKKSEYREIAADYLDMVGLAGNFDKLPGHMSGGMRQRAAIARAFAVNSPILLMDEPFGALDAITRAKLQDLLLGLWMQKNSERRTVFFVTHDVDEAILLATHIVVMGVNPGSVKGIIEVDIPRPRRRRGAAAEKQFQTIREKLVNILQENILNGLDKGETVLSLGEWI